MPSAKAIKQKTLTGVGNHIKLLPTGTVFLIQFLNPLFTNYGHCHPVNKWFSFILIAASGISCCFATFTDSYVDSDGVTHYGIVTYKGLWPAAPASQALPSHRLTIWDFVHAFCTMLAFAAVVLLDSTSLQCFFPSFESTHKTLLMLLPPLVGAITCTVFVMFPNKRHGIGYPHSENATPSSSSA